MITVMDQANAWLAPRTMFAASIQPHDGAHMIGQEGERELAAVRARPSRRVSTRAEALTGSPDGAYWGGARDGRPASRPARTGPPASHGRPWLARTVAAMFAGIGGSSRVRAATNWSAAAIPSKGLNRFSKASVDMGLPLIPVPHAEPEKRVG